MSVNKVIYDGTTLIDLTDADDLTSSDIVNGKKGYGASGNLITGTYSGGSSTVATTTTTPSSNSTSISFSVDGEPIMFCVQWTYNSASYMSGSSTKYITSVCSDGTNCYGTALYYSSRSGREYYYTTASFSYSSGTLTVTSPSSSTLGYFRNGYTYRLIYVY